MIHPTENDYVAVIYSHTNTVYAGRVEYQKSQFGFHVCDVVTTKRGERINLPVRSVFIGFSETVEVINLGKVLEI